MSASDYREIGLYLRDSRESLRVSVAQAAADLHIRAKYINALESGEVANLPGPAYTRGYIRNYAHYLRLDVDAVLKAYAPLLGDKPQELFAPEPTQQQNLPTPCLVWLSLAGLALLYAFWYFALHDRTKTAESVTSLPPALARLLDKTPPVLMDKAWADCLNSGDAGCFLALRAGSVSSADRVLYGAEAGKEILPK